MITFKTLGDVVQAADEGGFASSFRPLASRLASKLASRGLLASEASKLESDLLEIKQVVSKLKNDLLDSKQVENLTCLAPKQVTGFRLLLATDAEQVEAGLAPAKQVSKQVRGGLARSETLSPERRREIAMLGVEARQKNRLRVKL